MVVARGKTQLESQALILKAVSALTVSGETLLGGYLIKQMLPLTDPIIYPISAGQFIEQAVSFNVVFCGV